MSITKLKAHRDAVVEANIGLYLEVVKGLITVIDEHIAEDNAEQVVSAPVIEPAK